MKTSSRAVALGFAIFAVVASHAAFAQTPATGRLMREKLTHAQRLLEAIATSNFTLLEQESSALAAIPRSKGWMVLNSPEYRQHSAAFLRAADALVETAKKRDMDQAVKRYQDMTMTCYQCHRYIQNARIAR